LTFTWPFLINEMKYLFKQAALAMILGILPFSPLSSQAPTN